MSHFVTAKPQWNLLIVRVVNEKTEIKYNKSQIFAKKIPINITQIWSREKKCLQSAPSKSSNFLFVPGLIRLKHLIPDFNVFFILSTI